MSYFVRACDVPKMLGTFKGLITHYCYCKPDTRMYLETVEIDEYDTIKEALEAARHWAHGHRFPLYDNKPFPLNMIYITEYDDEGEQILSASYEEWQEKYDIERAENFYKGTNPRRG